MNRIVISLMFVVAIMSIPNDHTHAQDTKKTKTKPDRPVVQVSAGKPTAAESGKHSVELTLKIDPSVAIYSNEPHAKEINEPFLIPTTIQFLDINGDVIDAKINFPVGTLVNSVIGDYRVYSGSVKLDVTIHDTHSVEKLRLEFAGYRFSETVENGYS